jgi:hypothetical protein
MGILSKLAALPLAPVYGVVWVAKTVTEYAEREALGEQALRRRLAEVEAAFEAGEISERERNEAEEQLLTQLEVVRMSREGRTR